MSVRELNAERMAQIVAEHLDFAEVVECSRQMMARPGLISTLMNESKKHKVWGSEREVALWVLSMVREAARSGDA